MSMLLLQGVPPRDLEKMEIKKRVLGKNWGREVDIENNDGGVEWIIDYISHGQKSGMLNMPLEKRCRNGQAGMIRRGLGLAGAA